LPPLPSPIDLQATPTADGATITKESLVDLAHYMIAVRAWIAAAQICLDQSLFPGPTSQRGRVVPIERPLYVLPPFEDFAEDHP